MAKTRTFLVYIHFSLISRWLAIFLFLSQKVEAKKKIVWHARSCGQKWKLFRSTLSNRPKNVLEVTVCEYLFGYLWEIRLHSGMEVATNEVGTKDKLRALLLAKWVYLVFFVDWAFISMKTITNALDFASLVSSSSILSFLRRRPKCTDKATP